MELHEKISFDKKFCSSKQNWEHVFLHEMLWNGIPRVASIFVPWKGIPRSFLFHGMVRSGIPSVCLYLSSTEGNSGLIFLPRNGSERNSESLFLFLFHGTEFIFLLCGMFQIGILRVFCSVVSRNATGTSQLFRLFRLPLNNFFSSEIASLKLEVTSEYRVT